MRCTCNGERHTQRRREIKKKKKQDHVAKTRSGCPETHEEGTGRQTQRQRQSNETETKTETEQRDIDKQTETNRQTDTHLRNGTSTKQDQRFDAQLVHLVGDVGAELHPSGIRQHFRRVGVGLDALRGSIGSQEFQDGLDSAALEQPHGVAVGRRDQVG